MNRVFLTGRVEGGFETAYTPRGRRIVEFPLKVDEGDFGIRVIFSSDSLPRDLDERVGGRVTVTGTLVRTKRRAQDTLKVQASKIIWTEE